jgi:hemin uptake protein HemP
MKEPVAGGSQSRPPAQPRRVITSAELFGGAREIHIRHADEIYTLRQTNKGKLILTK